MTALWTLIDSFPEEQLWVCKGVTYYGSGLEHELFVGVCMPKGLRCLSITFNMVNRPVRGNILQPLQQLARLRRFALKVESLAGGHWFQELLQLTRKNYDLRALSFGYTSKETVPATMRIS